MSENTDHFPLATSSSSNNNNNNKRLLSHQHFVPTSSDFNTPSSIVSNIQNDSPSPQSHTSPIVSDVCNSSKTGVRNPSATTKTKDDNSPNGNHINNKYALTLDFTPPVAKTRKDNHRNSKSQLYTYNMAGNGEEDLHSPFELDVPLCENQSLKKIQNDFLIDRMLKDDSNSNFTLQHRSSNQQSYTTVLNHSSPLLTPSCDHYDIDALSDAGTYIIEDDIDIAHDDEPEQDIEQQNDRQEKISTPSTASSFKRYATTRRNRHGTFDIDGISSKTTHTVNRPIVDLNVPTHNLSPSSSSVSSANSTSSSSLLSLPTESDNSIRKEPEGASHHIIIDDKSSAGVVYARRRSDILLQQQQPRSITPPQNLIKPAECFVISPTFETKPFPNTTTTGPRRKPDIHSKSKPTASVVSTKDTHFEVPSKNSPSSPPLSARSNQSDTEKFSFRLQQQQQQQQQPIRHHDSKQQSSSSNLKSSLHHSDYVSSSSKLPLRPHTIINDQTYSTPFQRNSSIRQTMPANTQYNRALSSSTTTTTTKYVDDNEEILSSHPSLTKVYMNKSFALRRQRSHLMPSTSKPVQQQQQQQQQQQTISKPLSTRQIIKPTTSVPSTSLSINNSSGQTNRAVELRRARAQAKIEELAQRTRQQLQKTELPIDLMSASWHSNASSTSKKDFSQLRVNSRSTNNNNKNISTPKQDLLKTRTISTISTTSHHRSSSASPNPLGETKTKTSKYRKPMVSSVTSESQYQKMNGSFYREGERCDSLRDDGQRLAIKLIQLSSGILAKLKPNNSAGDSDSNVRELEQLVDQLQTVNRTLSSIDASLTGSTSDEILILVDIFLPVSHSSIVDMEDKNAHSRYEQSLLAWRTNDERLNKEKLSMKNIPERNDLQLIGAQIFFRHGARTPLNLLPSLEEVIYNKEQIENYPPSKWDIKLITKKGNEVVSKDKVLSAHDITGSEGQKLKSVSGENVMKGQLTAIGEKQLFQLGRLLRSELIDDNNDKGLLPATYDSQYVYCRSTYMDRTIASARSFLAGLFSSVKMDNKIQANGPFEMEVQHFPDEDMFPNPNIYPILKKCLSVPSFYMSLNDDHELKKARQALINRIGFTESPHGIVGLYDDIVSRQAHNFTVPEDILELVKDFEIMSAREYVYISTAIGYDLFIRAGCGPILYLMRENFNSILKNYLEEKNNNLKKPYHKFFIYSGHDSTLIPLAMAFEIFEMRWPKYASYILIKYFISKTNPDETYVTVKFDGEAQILPDCQDYYCPYSTFLKNLQNRFDKPKISS
ncbi:unnamed protein product [Rotaria sordida]|uniref:2-phosphoxylose phosphatase 1 n=1 Tax=Rotaria sordida TaxID=392033 RepID=A0A813S211_9BILA|nr:unnamed protein product [Rotaria sordida]CAF0793642.1 unnamed protein product [Rotaria sordida]